MARARRSRRRTRSRSGRRSIRARRSGRRLRHVAWLAFRGALFVTAPFFLLVRGSVLAHRHFGTHGWISLGVGGLLASLALAVVAAWLWRRLTGRRRFVAIARNLALPAVAIFSLYCLGWLSSLNAKSPEIHDLYTDLHPSLRLALGTVILADPDVVITEIRRSPSDYRRMGLPPVERSLHFEQPDGWIHAVDLRTRGRSGLHNGLSQLYFRAMGFRALRHGGTGDHLHVALPRPLR